MNRLARWWAGLWSHRDDDRGLYAFRITAAALQVAVGAAQLGFILLNHR